MTLRFAAGDLTHPAVVDLLRFHITSALANSPANKVHALDLADLRDPAVTFWSVWDAEALVGMGALKMLEPGHAEIKSMRVAAMHQRRGVGAAILQHLLDEAHGGGLQRVSLETGGNQAFAAARAIYERAGFVPCAPFADYGASAFNRYYTLTL